MLVAYDWHGNYGHPDHIKVHDVGYAAAALAATPNVFEATVNRDEMRRRFSEQAQELAAEGQDFDADGPADDGNPMGEPESEICLRVDVSDYLIQKRAALTEHRSQITDQSFFSKMSDETFRAAFGTEWFKQRGVQGPPRDGWLVPAP